jgi:hypothetical protein
MIVIALGERRLRFGELRTTVDGISGKVLTDTLRDLERDGLVTRHVYAEMPPRVEYELTALGRTLHRARSGDRDGMAQTFIESRREQGVLLPLEGGRTEPGRVFDRTVGLDGVPDGSRAMDDREVLKVMVQF